MVELVLARCVVRDLRVTDAEAMARCANDRRISSQLRDRFPHPYALSDAHAFLNLVKGEDPPHVLAITAQGEFAGAIGFELRGDVERCGAELGYWLGVDHWGRGIATEAIRAVTEWGMQQWDLQRVFATPFADNAGSCRALEKAGFVLEGTLRRSAIKDGVIRDQRMYAMVR